MKRISGVIFIVFFLFLYFSGIPIKQNKPADPSDQVDNYIKEVMTQFHITGLSLAVVENGEVIKSRGYGLSNVEYHIPAQERSIFQLASVTKQFTATAIMMLVEENKINLDDRITTYLPNLPLDWQNITIRHLLTHTSGIVNYTNVPELWGQNLYPISKEELIKSVAKYPLEFQPGDDWSYCNTGYIILGTIVEKVSGQTFNDFLQQRIFIPLNMKNTSLNDLNRIVLNRASGYMFTGSRLTNTRYPDTSWLYSTGGLISTVTDMAKWDAALYTEKILTRKSLEQMWTPVTLNNGLTVGYGFGWGIGIINDHRVVGHSGGIDGYCSNILRFIDDRISVIVLINQVPAPVGNISFDIASFYVKGLKKPGDKATNSLQLNLIKNDFLGN